MVLWQDSKICPMLRKYKKNNKNRPNKRKIQKYIYLAIFITKRFFQLKIIFTSW